MNKKKIIINYQFDMLYTLSRIDIFIHIYDHKKITLLYFDCVFYFDLILLLLIR